MVTYPKEMRDRAKSGGLFLCTISAHGMEFQGPCTAEERDEIFTFMVTFVSKHSRRGWAEEGGSDNAVL